jgi:hypothetical protein
VTLLSMSCFCGVSSRHHWKWMYDRPFNASQL